MRGAFRGDLNWLDLPVRWRRRAGLRLPYCRPAREIRPGTLRAWSGLGEAASTPSSARSPRGRSGQVWSRLHGLEMPPHRSERVPPPESALPQNSSRAEVPCSIGRRWHPPRLHGTTPSAFVLTAEDENDPAGAYPSPFLSWILPGPQALRTRKNRGTFKISPLQSVLNDGDAMIRRSLSLLRSWKLWLLILLAVCYYVEPADVEAQGDNPKWLMATAYHIPSEYTNQESGYFSIVEGLNGRLYIGCAKYGVNAYLVEFDPVKSVMKMVVDVHRVIHSMLRGFGAQAKIHTRNNVGASGKIYFGSKQGYPEKGEKLTDYPGGHVLVYDPKTGQTEDYGIPIKHHGVISVTPDESRGLAY